MSREWQYGDLVHTREEWSTVPFRSEAVSTVTGAPIVAPYPLDAWDEGAPYRITYRGYYTDDEMMADPEIFSRVSRTHGLGLPADQLSADVEHLINPLIGMIRLDLVPVKDYGWLTERLYLTVCLARKSRNTPPTKG